MTAIQNGTSGYVNQIQNGSLSSNQALNATLYNGAFFPGAGATGLETTTDGLEDLALTISYSQLLIPGWSLAAIDTGLGSIFPTIL